MTGLEIEVLDFLFVHPPAVTHDNVLMLDADVAYTYQFVAIPIGVFSMADALDKAGYKVKIINLGEKMINRESFDSLAKLVQEMIYHWNPRIVGLDIHWWVHSAGAIETAKTIKRISEETKVVVGGITSSFFAEEILEKYPWIDYVMTGECDQAIVDFVKAMQSDMLNETWEVPNLVYRWKGRISKNPVFLPYIEESLETTRYDLLTEAPRVNQDRAIVSITRGCTQQCNYCGASRLSFKNTMQRPSLSLIRPKTLVDLIYKNKEKGKDKIYIYGDLRIGGEEYVNTFFELMDESDVCDIHIVFEMFLPPSIGFLKKWTRCAAENNITLEATISPDSGNEIVRRRSGRFYSNDDLLKACRTLVREGIPMCVYFLLGLPDETHQTIEESLALADEIIRIYAMKFQKDSVRHEIIGYEFMQIPDLGSLIHLNTDKYGIKLYFDGFAGLVDLISTSTHWSQLIGFSTRHFSQEEFVEKFYFIKKTIFKLYRNHGLISDNELDRKLNMLDDDREVFLLSRKNNPYMATL